VILAVSANAAAAAPASARQGAIQMFSPTNLVLDEASFGTKHGAFVKCEKPNDQQ
jgi:hypothetical protein